jgi:hypothetical protein
MLIKDKKMSLYSKAKFMMSSWTCRCTMNRTMKHGLGQPVFCQTHCYAFALLSTVVLIVCRCFGSVGKPQRGTKVSIVSGLCVPLYLFVGFGVDMSLLIFFALSTVFHIVTRIFAKFCPVATYE